MKAMRTTDNLSAISDADPGPGLNGFTTLPTTPQRREDVLAELRMMIARSSPPTPTPGVALDNRTVASWSARTVDQLARAVGLPAAFTRVGGGIGFVSSSATEFARLALAGALTRAGRTSARTGAETVYLAARPEQTVTAAVLAAGLGAGALRWVDTAPETGRMSATAVRRAIREDTANGRRPVMVAAVVGDSCGIADDLVGIGSVAQEVGVWLHVDAPAGAYAMLPKRRSLLAGVAKAQSVCLDPGVLVNTGIPCAAGWTTDPAAVRAPALINALGARQEFLGLDAPERTLALALAVHCSGQVALRAHLRAQVNALRKIRETVRADPQWTMAVPEGIGSTVMRVNSGQGRAHDDILTQRVIDRLTVAGLRTVRGAELAGRPVIAVVPHRVDVLSASQVWGELTAALAAAATRDRHTGWEVRYA